MAKGELGRSERELEEARARRLAIGKGLGGVNAARLEAVDDAVAAEFHTLVGAVRMGCAEQRHKRLGLFLGRRPLAVGQYSDSGLVLLGVDRVGVAMVIGRETPALGRQAAPFDIDGKARQVLAGCLGAADHHEGADFRDRTERVERRGRRQLADIIVQDQLAATGDADVDAHGAQRQVAQQAVRVQVGVRVEHEAQHRLAGGVVLAVHRGHIAVDGRRFERQLEADIEPVALHLGRAVGRQVLLHFIPAVSGGDADLEQIAEHLEEHVAAVDAGSIAQLGVVHGDGQLGHARFQVDRVETQVDAD